MFFLHSHGKPHWAWRGAPHAKPLEGWTPGKHKKEKGWKRTPNVPYQRMEMHFVQIYEWYMESRECPNVGTRPSLSHWAPGSGTAWDLLAPVPSFRGYVVQLDPSVFTPFPIFLSLSVSPLYGSKLSNFHIWSLIFAVENKGLFFGVQRNSFQVTTSFQASDDLYHHRNKTPHMKMPAKTPLEIWMHLRKELKKQKKPTKKNCCTVLYLVYPADCIIVLISWWISSKETCLSSKRCHGARAAVLRSLSHRVNTYGIEA